MSTALRTYYHGYDLVAMRDEQAAQSRYFHVDHQGTTQALTDATSAVTDRFTADAWGVPVRRTGTSINRHWYVGGRGYQRDPDTGRDYVRARYLEGARGQWISRDPVGSAIRAYAYGENSSALETDPTGLQVCGKGGGCYQPSCGSGRTLPCPKNPCKPEPGECNPGGGLPAACKLIDCGKPECTVAMAKAQSKQMVARLRETMGGIGYFCAPKRIGGTSDEQRENIDPYHAWAVTVCCEKDGDCVGVSCCLECEFPDPTRPPRKYRDQVSCVQQCLGDHENKHTVQCRFLHAGKVPDMAQIECEAWKAECECLCRQFKQLLGLRYGTQCSDCCRSELDARKARRCEQFLEEVA